MSLSPILLSVRSRGAPVPPSNASGRKSPVASAEKVDWMSTLPDHLLLMILTKIPSEDAMRTSVLSQRWENVWKQLPFVSFDMLHFKFEQGSLVSRAEFIAELMMKVVRNLDGNLDAFLTPYFSSKCKDTRWIQTLIHVKHTQCLALVNPLGHRWNARKLHLRKGTFSHPSLKTLLLFQYDLVTPRAFKNCVNLTILKLEDIYAEIDVFNKLIASCPSLKILELNISWHNPIGCLKIHNNNLELLRLVCSYIINIDISANLLDIFSLISPFATQDDVVLTVPRLLQFNNIHRLDEMKPHLSYNITSDDAQEAHGIVVNRNNNFLKRYTSLSVSVDLMNPREVEKLSEVLLAWEARRDELEIVFKDSNVPKEEGEYSVGGSQKMKRQEEKLVLSADFRVDVVLMYNFNGSNEGKIELASRFVTQGMVVQKLMIQTSSIFGTKKLEIEAAVAKLMKLPKGNKELSIECF